MEETKSKKEELILLAQKLIEYGIEREKVLNFIENNLSILLNKDIDLKNHIFYLFNNQFLYGIIIANENIYYWSNYIDGDLTALSSSEECINDNDSVIDMIINFADNKKIKDIIPTEDENIECKLKILKNIGLNKNGYHVK